MKRNTKRPRKTKAKISKAFAARAKKVKTTRRGQPPVRIVEVGPRDGLQNEKNSFSVEERILLVKNLAAAGLQNIEAGAFVSAQWVPQMQNSNAVISKLLKMQEQSALPKNLNISALVPNERGMQDALRTKVPEVAIFGSASETFSKKNINCSIAESFIRFRKVMELAKANNLRVRGYLSAVFGCPYEGKVSEARAIRLVRAMLNLGVYEISLGDTIGVATPKQVESVLRKVKKITSLDKIALHMHDTRGTALANVLQGYNLGVRTFDTSVGGLGGCPYAKGASGNLATEDLVYMFHGMGIKTGIDLPKLVAMRSWIEERVGHKLPAKVSQAGIGCQALI